jgi:DinB superfamily
MEHPQPDDKNWTWVLERPCPDCRFDARTIARHAIGATLRTIVEAWQEVLSRGALVRQRPPRRPDGGVIWSALEYGCHVRDVCILFDERLRLMLTQPDPTFLNWDQDATAIATRYWEDDPITVREVLREAGGRLAAAFDQVRDHQWARTGTRSDGARFTVESFGRYFLHDPIHHLWDVRRGFEALA